MTEPDPVRELERAVAELGRREVRFALIGGLAVSVRSEVRFTRGIDVAVLVQDDAELERLIRELGSAGYVAKTLVEHEERKRLATVRLASSSAVTVDLMAASSGIEREVVERALLLRIDSFDVPVARVEELLALKVLSMDARRLQDRIDALSLLHTSGDALDLATVRDNLERVRSRGYDRGQDLAAKLAQLLEEAGREQ